MRKKSKEHILRLAGSILSITLMFWIIFFRGTEEKRYEQILLLGAERLFMPTFVENVVATDNDIDCEVEIESNANIEEILALEAADENYIDDKTGELVGKDETAEEVTVSAEQQVVEETAIIDEANEEQAEVINENTEVTTEVSPPEIDVAKYRDFDKLIQTFYKVDPTTNIDSSQLNIDDMMSEDMKLSDKGDPDNPRVLIYHTHSQEGYVDSTDDSNTVMGVGEHLAQLLRDNYGISVLHHMGKYDVESRDSAYSRAAVGLSQVLADNPSIQVVIDLHRDGVAETTHLVTDMNGRPTAQIMFFNGLSRTTAGEISYLPNENLHTNLAFSFQMQATAERYYTGLTRPIYLKGYRYNMHFCPRSLLIEVGAQTNTVEEAMNAMGPLADILSKVILG